MDNTKQYRIVLTSHAKDDLIDISDYMTYTLPKQKMALDLVRRLRMLIASLEEFPKRLLGAIFSFSNLVRPMNGVLEVRHHMMMYVVDIGKYLKF